MSSPQPSWDLFAAFLVVMREGSLSAAARALRTAQPTVRRQIEALEQALGVALFTRSPTGLRPTEAAHHMLPYAETMAAAADAFVRMSSGSAAGNTGTVRVTCSQVIGVEVLPQILATLIREHPGLEIELALTNKVEDLLRRDADIAVRMTRPSQAALVAKKIGEIKLGLYASERYLSEHQTPRTINALIEKHRLVGEDRGVAMRQALRAITPALGELRLAYRTDDDLAQLAAVRAGVGVGICQVGLAAKGSGLRRVLPRLEFPLETWVVMHEDLRALPRVRIVFDHLVEGLSEYAKRR